MCILTDACCESLSKAPDYEYIRVFSIQELEVKAVLEELRLSETRALNAFVGKAKDVGSSVVKSWMRK